MPEKRGCDGRNHKAAFHGGCDGIELSPCYDPVDRHTAKRKLRSCITP
ncbi:MAG: hypothetical protein ABJA60_08355 [Nitrosospira sp.]